MYMKLRTKVMMLTLQTILVIDFIVNHNALTRLTNMVSPIFYSMVVMVWDMLINYSEMLPIVIFLFLVLSMWRTWKS